MFKKIIITVLSLIFINHIEVVNAKGAPLSSERVHLHIANAPKNELYAEIVASINRLIRKSTDIKAAQLEEATKNANVLHQ